MPAYFVEGWTEPILYTLRNDGAAINLAGKTVTLYLYDSNRKRVPVGAVALTDATNGVVAFTPAIGDLSAAKSPYMVRFHVSDGYFVPNEEQPETWIVSKT